MPESVAKREDGVRHVLEEHDDHRALIRVLAKRFGVTEKKFIDEVVAEVQNITR